MAYLLTEIALEMLGCKFYDIHGAHQEMNDFQQNTQRPENLNPAENLENIVNYRRTTSPANLQQISEKSNDKLQQIPLFKLMAKEYGIVKQQILHNKETNLEKQVDNNITSTRTAQSLVQNFVESEIVKLRCETQTLHNFRRLVEQNILKVNPISFEKYLRLFATSPASANSKSSPVINKLPKSYIISVVIWSPIKMRDFKPTSSIAGLGELKTYKTPQGRKDKKICGNKYSKSQRCKKNNYYQIL
ncbi:hypothetical protein GQX74_009551 [Glossina fuscipes]|nr:hypothetical protein GQX74_009551 [Glossina fuscipes]